MRPVRPRHLVAAAETTAACHGGGPTTARWPGVQGNAEVSAVGCTRCTSVFGTDTQLLQVWNAKLALGRSLPADNPRTARGFANLLGRRLRICDETFRVIGMLAAQRQLLGFDLDDAVYIPAGRAMALFNRERLMETDVRYAADVSAGLMADYIRQLVVRRHGSEDFTNTSQEDMLGTLNGILGILTLAVGTLGGISLLVGAVGIFIVMNIGVRECTAEIGPLSALGAHRGQVLTLFLGEALVLAARGGARLLALLVPALPVPTPGVFARLAEILPAVIGLLAAVLPAQRRATLDPVEALREK